jgi:hypothetical protein
MLPPEARPARGFEPVSMVASEKTDATETSEKVSGGNKKRDGFKTGRILAD